MQLTDKEGERLPLCNRLHAQKLGRKCRERENRGVATPPSMITLRRPFEKKEPPPPSEEEQPSILNCSESLAAAKWGGKNPGVALL